MATAHIKRNNDIYIHKSSTKKDAVNSLLKPSVFTVPDNKNISLEEKVVKPQPIKKTVYDHIYRDLQEQNPDESIIWIGRSSQLVHITTYIFCFLLGILVLPLLIAYVVYLQTKHTIFVLTTERLRVYSGVLTKQVNDLELYRVKDTKYTQPFLFRFFGLSNIQLYTSDITWGESTIPGIENGMMLREKIRKIVEEARSQKGVKEFDYYTRNAPIPTQ